MAGLVPAIHAFHRRPGPAPACPRAPARRRRRRSAEPGPSGDPSAESPWPGVPVIHAFGRTVEAWIPGPSPGMTALPRTPPRRARSTPDRRTETTREGTRGGWPSWPGSSRPSTPSTVGPAPACPRVPAQRRRRRSAEPGPSGDPSAESPWPGVPVIHASTEHRPSLSLSPLGRGSPPTGPAFGGPEDRLRGSVRGDTIAKR